MEYFFKTYILLNLEDYFGEGYDIQPMIWMLFLCIGLCLACFFIHFQNNALLLTVKQLSRHKALDAASAKTARELGLASHRLVCFLLRRGEGQLYRAICRLGEEKLSYEEFVARQKDRKNRKTQRISLEDERFYISKETRPYATQLLERSRDTILRPIAATAAILLVYLAIALLMPSILSLLTAA